MYLGKDITGQKELSPEFLLKLAELDNPPINSFGYQETPFWGGDLLTYNGDWGSSQQNLNPQGTDGALEKDPPISYQGENPEKDADFATSVYASEQVPVAEPWGDDYAKPKDQGGGWNSPDLMGTLPQGFGGDPGDAEVYPVVTGYENGFDGVMDSPFGEGTVRTAGAGMTEIEKMANMVRAHLDDAGIERAFVDDTFTRLASSAHKVAGLAASQEISPEVSSIRIASLDQLFAFRGISANKLIHMSSNDLWTIEAGVDGEILINRQFDASGNPIKG